MTDSNDKPTDISGWVVGRGDRIAALSDYFVAHADRFTPEALRKAAADVGFSAAEIDEAYGRATTLQRTYKLAQPLRSRARWVVLAAYVIVWLEGRPVRLGAGSTARARRGLSAVRRV